MIKSVKKAVFILCFLIALCASCKKKSDPSPTPTKITFDTTNIIGTWEIISGRTYTIQANGKITGDSSVISNDTIKGEQCLAYEYTKSNMINVYLASFYDEWGKDTVMTEKNAYKYHFIDNSHMKSDIDTMEILILTSTDMTFRLTEKDDDQQDVSEYTFKKIKGNTFKDFVFVP